MRRVIDNDLLTMAARLFVGLTFIYASYYKIIDPGAFAKSIWYYHLVPGSMINLMALVLPWLELFCGVAVIVGTTYRGSVLLLNLMTVVFIVALASTIARGINIDCGCFQAAKASSASAWRALGFDLVLWPMVLLLWFSRSRRWMADKRSD